MAGTTDFNMMSPFAGMAIKQIKQNKGVPDTIFGIPLQIGPGTPNARNLSHWLWTFVGMQAVVCGLQLCYLSDITGALEMGLTIAIGYWALQEDMNVTYTTLWGALCLLFGVLGLLALILPLLEDVLTLDILNIAAQACVPVVYFLGALFACHLYHVWAKAESMPDIPAAFDPLGKFVDDHDPFDVKHTGEDAFTAAKKAASEYTPLMAAGFNKNAKKFGCC